MQFVSRGSHFLTLLIGAWAAWLWGWAVGLLFTWLRGPRGDTDLRLIALWFAVLGVAPFLTAVARWRSVQSRGFWVGLGVLSLLVFASPALSWLAVTLVSSFRTGSWDGVFAPLLTWDWVRNFLIRPLSWRDWLGWLAWGLWSQLVLALHAFLSAAWGVGKKTPPGTPVSVHDR